MPGHRCLRSRCRKIERAAGLLQIGGAQNGNSRSALVIDPDVVVADAVPERVAQAGGQINLDIECGGRKNSVSGSHLLVAAGRRPNTDDLGIDKAGIEIDSHGFIRVNERLETNVPGVFAVGDVRHGSVKRVASGVGEGSVAVQFIHQYLSKV